jgi:hypothetical protein
MMNMEKVEVEMQLEVHRSYKIRESVMIDGVFEEVRGMVHLSLRVDGCDDDAVAATDL